MRQRLRKRLALLDQAMPSNLATQITALLLLQLALNACCPAALLCPTCSSSRKDWSLWSSCRQGERARNKEGRGLVLSLVCQRAEAVRACAGHPAVRHPARLGGLQSGASWPQPNVLSESAFAAAGSPATT